MNSAETSPPNNAFLSHQGAPSFRPASLRTTSIAPESKLNRHGPRFNVSIATEHSIVTFSNTGAKLLLGGQYEDAAAYFGRALQLFRKAANPNFRHEQHWKHIATPRRQVRPKDPRRTQSKARSETIQPTIHSMEEDKASCDHRQEMAALHISSTEGAGAVYSDPFILDVEEFHQEMNCFRGYSAKIAVGLIFNMALAYTLIARSTNERIIAEALDHDTEIISGETYRTQLKRALSLYHLSCRIQVNERMIIDQGLSMAHVNNLSWIHARLGNKEMARSLCERLVSSFVLYKEIRSRDKCSRSGSTNNPKSSVFQANVARFLLRDGGLAAAA